MSYRASPWVVYKCAFCPITDEQERLECVKFATPAEENPLKPKYRGDAKMWRYRHVCTTCGAKTKAIADAMAACGEKK
jgi:methyl coenzyme M reductase gamma subunit